VDYRTRRCNGEDNDLLHQPVIISPSTDLESLSMNPTS
jgi:hypothetical protein